MSQKNTVKKLRDAVLEDSNRLYGMAGLLARQGIRLRSFKRSMHHHMVKRGELQKALPWRPNDMPTLIIPRAGLNRDEQRQHHGKPAEYSARKPKSKVDGKWVVHASAE